MASNEIIAGYLRDFGTTKIYHAVTEVTQNAISRGGQLRSFPRPQRQAAIYSATSMRVLSSPDS